MKRSQRNKKVVKNPTNEGVLLAQIFTWLFFCGNFFVAFALFLAVPLNVGKLRWIKTSRVFLLPPQEDIVCLEGTGPNTVVSN